MAALIAALTPLGLAAFQAWAVRNPTASDDQLKAHLATLAAEDAGRKVDFAIGEDDLADARARVEAGE